MRLLAFALVGLLGMGCPSSSKDDTGAADDTGTAADLDADADTDTDADADSDDTGDDPDLDLDDDGFDGGDDGDDCDDDDDTVYPGAEEVAYDGIDQDCDGADLTDVDGDGFDGGAEGDDCDDADETSYPGAEEVAYDGIDQDCDGADLTDVDGDGFDGGDEGDDCDDADETSYPGAEEVAYDGIDQDCDGADLTDVDGDGFDGGDEGDDCDDADATAYPGAEEVPYDDIDQDCDGADLTDVDGDGFDHLVDCDDEDATAYPFADEVPYDGIDQDCDGTDLTDVDGDGADGGDEGDDCNDDDASVYPDAEDTADLVDSDCDGLVDDDAISANDIMLTEAMINPDGDPEEILDGDGEWFELYNDADFDINIVGWTFTDAGVDSITIEGDLIIASGGYLVLGNNDDVETNGGVEIDYAYDYGNFRLANTDDEFVVSMGETEIFSLAWSAADWPYSPGYAMGWDWDGDVTLGDSWCAQMSMLTGGDYGTPGADNDSCDDLTCSLGAADVGVVIDGDTTDSENNFEGSCSYASWGYETGPDDAYTYTAAEDGCYTASVTVLGWTAVISRWTECGGEELDCEGADYVGYDEETGSYIYTAEYQTAMDAGETALFVVDGFATAFGDYGSYELSVAAVEEVATAPDAYEDIGSATGDAVVSGTTIGLAHDGDHYCSSTSGGTEILSWTAPADGCYYFDLSESDYDTVMSVFSGGDACGVGEACNDDDGGLTSGVEVDLAEGDMTTILISGYGSGEGDYVLDINPCSE